LKLGLGRRSVQYPGIVIRPNWAKFSVHHTENSGFFAEPQFELRTRSLWHMKHDSVFFKRQELRTGESRTMLNKKEPWGGVNLPFRHQFSGTPFIYSDDATGPKGWRRMQVSFPNFGIKKSSLVQRQ
jgi:hypothetical protein